MKKTDKKTIIILLALLHSYGMGVAFLVFFCLWGYHRLAFLLTGVAFLIHSVWSFIGYRYKWKHVYCSYQSWLHKQKMSPDKIKWQKIDRKDANRVPLISLILGLISLFFSMIIDQI